ncbi:hypothetical protein V6Z12_D02G205000 [Gossypium hirsutum]
MLHGADLRLEQSIPLVYLWGNTKFKYYSGSENVHKQVGKLADCSTIGASSDCSPWGGHLPSLRQAA